MKSAGEEDARQLAGTLLLRLLWRCSDPEGRFCRNHS